LIVEVLGIGDGLLGTMQTATDAVTEHRLPKAPGLESN
jgi:hypothetical protein